MLQVFPDTSLNAIEELRKIRHKSLLYLKLSENPLCNSKFLPKTSRDKEMI